MKTNWSATDGDTVNLTAVKMEYGTRTCIPPVTDKYHDAISFTFHI